MSRIQQLLVFPFADLRQALKKGDIYGPPIPQALLEEPSVVLAAQLECEITALIETAMAVQSDSAYAALNNRKSSTAASNRGVLLSAQHLQVALRRDPKFIPLSSDANDAKQLMSVLDEFLDQGLADVLQIKLPASLSQRQEQVGDSNDGSAAGGENNPGATSTSNKWSRRRDDVITDVEFSSLLKRIHPGYFFGSDALMLLTALMREILTVFASRMVNIGSLRVAENVDDLSACVGGVVPPSLKKRCNDAGGLALAVLRGTLVGSPNVTIRFVLLKLAASSGSGGGGGASSSSSSGSGLSSASTTTADPKLGYAVTVPRKESLHEVMLSASKRFHFEEKKAAVFLFRGNAVDGTQNADDLLIVASAVVFVVQRQWWDFQRREEARRGVLTSTKSNDAAVRAMRTNASSKVALTVQQYVTGPQPGTSDLDAVNSEDGGGSGLGGSGRRSEVSAPRGRQGGGGGGARSVSPVRGRVSPSLESGGARDLSLPPSGSRGVAGSNPTSPYNMSPRPGGGRGGGAGRSLLVIPEQQQQQTSSPSRIAKGSASVAVSESMSPKKGVEVPIKFARAIHATAGRAIDALNLSLPELVRAQFLVDQTFPGGLDTSSQSDEMTEILDLRSLRKVGTLIENTGKEIRALVTSLESVTAKKAVQAQARKFASTKRPPPTQVQSPKAPFSSSQPISTVMEPTTRSSAKAAVGNMGAKVLQRNANESLKKVTGRASPRLLESPPPRMMESPSPSSPVPLASRLPRPSAPVRLSPAMGARSEDDKSNEASSSSSPSSIIRPAPRAAPLNRLNGRQSPIMTSLPGPAQHPQTQAAPVQTSTSRPEDAHEYVRGPDVEFAPIPNVKLSGAVLSSSSKLKFNKA